MYVTSTLQSEIRITLESALEIVNRQADDDFDLREVLVESGYSRAEQASMASLDRLSTRMGELASLLLALPDLEPGAAQARVNEELTELPISPWIVDHGGVGPHMHWTPVTARFDDQVMSDVVMALAQELVDNGLERFGRCAAADCDRVFYDSTRNHSRRFCPDPRCASRTHTADHRARRKG